MRIKELRQEKGMSQAKLAELVGAKQADIHRWENNKRGITAESLIKLANVFETSIDEILGRTNNYGAVIIQSSLAPEENDIINDYRELPQYLKIEARAYIKGLRKACARS